MVLASKFRNIAATRSDRPLSDDEIMRVATSVFADGKHESRSERYTYILTIDVLNVLRDDGQRDHTKHMIRLRHGSQIESKEANEIILLNSHNGTSSYQMLAGMFRFVCHNGMVCGEMLIVDIRVPHKGDVVGRVIEGAFTVLGGFELVNEQRDSMKWLTLNTGEQQAFARAALTIKYDDPETPAPVTETQVLAPRCFEDRVDDMWTMFNRVQESLLKGGLRSRNLAGRTSITREVTSIDQNVKLNRALWVLARRNAQVQSLIADGKPGRDWFPACEKATPEGNEMTTYTVEIWVTRTFPRKVPPDV